MVILDIIELVRFFRTDVYTDKAYEEMDRIDGLKNYLNEYSLIKEKTVMEVYLWERFLAYAIMLEVNVNIEKEIGINFEGLKKQLEFINEIESNNFML